MESLPLSSVFSIIVEPLPTSPSRFDSGTLQSSKNNSEVSDALHIILLCIDLLVNPAVSFSTIIVENSFLPSFFVPVTARTVTPLDISTAPLVIKHLDPFIFQYPSASLAVVLVPRQSDPASGSVSPKAQSSLPEHKRGK